MKKLTKNELNQKQIYIIQLKSDLNYNYDLNGIDISNYLFYSVSGNNSFYDASSNMGR